MLTRLRATRTVDCLEIVADSYTIKVDEREYWANEITSLNFILIKILFGCISSVVSMFIPSILKYFVKYFGEKALRGGERYFCI